MFYPKLRLQLLGWVLFLPCLLAAQLTIRVNSIPVNTPTNDKIYIVGNFNNWNPGDANYILTAIGGGQYEITFNPPVGTLQFKFTRGSWATVEGNASGNFLPDRTFNYNGQATNLVLSILSWEGQGGGGGGTAAPNVNVMNSDFYMPQLNRYRRIWIYLPPDYATSNKNYPVLYLQDGQNLFDAQTSAFGEWKVDESLNDLFAKGDYGCIVVGIDNGGQYRLDEYSPWVNSQYGGGQGALYLQFIVETLKPYVDANFRTLSARIATGIGGSSMGGLIAQYGLSERQDVFSKAAVFSPAFWFAGNASINHVITKGKSSDVRVYYLAGGEEPISVTNNLLAVKNAMLTAGFEESEMLVKLPNDGAHSEWFWAREFPAAYVWLFQNAVTDAHTPSAVTDAIDIFPNPSSTVLRINNTEKIDYKIFTFNGLVLREGALAPGDSIAIDHLPNGFFYLKMEKNGQWLGTRKFCVAR